MNRQLLGGLGILLLSATSWGADASRLRVGAARIDITPPLDWGLTNAWGTKLDSVHDPIFVRAIYMATGQDQAAIIALDAVGNDQSDEMLKRIEHEVQIPAQHVLIASSHDHNG